MLPSIPRHRRERKLLQHRKPNELNLSTSFDSVHRSGGSAPLPIANFQFSIKRKLHHSFLRSMSGFNEGVGRSQGRVCLGNIFYQLFHLQSNNITSSVATFSLSHSRHPNPSGQWMLRNQGGSNYNNKKRTHSDCPLSCSTKATRARPLIPTGVKLQHGDARMLLNSAAAALFPVFIAT